MQSVLIQKEKKMDWDPHLDPRMVEGGPVLHPTTLRVAWVARGEGLITPVLKLGADGWYGLQD